MFLLFYSLYYAMFTGTWINHTWNSFTDMFKPVLNAIGTLITSIFGNATYTTLGTDFNDAMYIGLLSMILATITSIGIVVVATKGIKKIFTVFFYGVR